MYYVLPHLAQSDHATGNLNHTHHTMHCLSGSGIFAIANALGIEVLLLRKHVIDGDRSGRATV